jgi:hypothetical protein
MTDLEDELEELLSRAGSLAAVLGALARVCSDRGLEQTSDARCWNLAAVHLGRVVAAIERAGHRI